jgi:S-adenosylmethionine:tRNA-ribosyltransferase-isomerase (queuine synthetase)
MVGNEWNYHLPPELIAQQPLEDRAASRLLVYDRTNAVAKIFSFISGLLQTRNIHNFCNGLNLIKII